jgi:membrane-associated phospholipid phosphatase
MLINLIFFDILHIKRSSPSLVLEPFLRLSEYFGDHDIKDNATKSFPGGHGFVMPYFAIFSMKFFPKRIFLVTWIVAIFFCLPRLMSGAHWITDIIFSTMLAYFCANIVICTPLYSMWVNALANRFRSFSSSYKKIIKACGISR